MFESYQATKGLGKSLDHLRKLQREMVKRVPEWCKHEGSLLDGGDLRLRKNLWLRSAYKASGLGRVPRETRLRAVVRKVIKKVGISALYHFNINASCGVQHRALFWHPSKVLAWMMQQKMNM